MTDVNRGGDQNRPLAVSPPLDTHTGPDGKADVAGQQVACPGCGAVPPPSADLTCPACGTPLPSRYHGPGGIGYFIAIYALLMLLTVLGLALYVWLG